MTATELAKVDHASKFLAKFNKAVLITFMVTGLFLSGTLLKWAVDNKLNNRFSVEGSNVTVQMRERQLGCLAKNIYHEAGHEPFEGKVAVAQVTMNRSESGKFPDDICRVIFQKNIIYEKIICEFSWVCDREISFKPVNKVAYDESMEVAKKVLLEGFRLPSLKEAMFFHGDYIKPGWNRTRIAQIGHHIFYK